MTDQNILDSTEKGELVQFNLVDMKDQVADQMRAFLLNMMPKEAFDQVIEASWKKLTEPRPEVRDSYGHIKAPAKPSELEDMITVEMRQELRKRVAAWAVEWGKTDDCSLGAKTMFSELIAAASGQFIHRVGVQIVQEAAQVLSSGAGLDVVQCTGCHRTAIKSQMCQCGNWN
jgi:hypothetical protein